MKKLLTFLISLNILTIPVTNIISCSVNNDNNDNNGDDNKEYEDEVLNSTQDITKTLLLGRGENFDILGSDPFYTSKQTTSDNEKKVKFNSGTGMLDWFSNASTSLVGDWNTIIAEHYQGWGSAFGDYSSTSKSAGDFIDPASNSFSNNDGTIIANDSDLSWAGLAGSEGGIYTTPSFLNKNSIIYQLSKNSSTVSSPTSQISQMFKTKMDAEKGRTLLRMFSTITSFSKTFGQLMPTLSFAGSSINGLGAELLTGGASSAGAQFKGTDLQNDSVQIIPYAFETLWKYMIDNSEKISSDIGVNAFKFLTGTTVNQIQVMNDDQKYLIKKLSDYQKKDENIKKIMRGDGTTDKTIFSVNDQFKDSQFGKALNAISNLRFNFYSHEWDGTTDDLGGGNLNQQSEINMLNKNSILMIEEIQKIYSIISNLASIQMCQELLSIYSNAMKSVGWNLLLNAIGIKSDDDSKNALLSFINDVYGCYVGVNMSKIDKNSSIDDINNAFSFSEDIPNALRSIRPALPDAYNKKDGVSLDIESKKPEWGFDSNNNVEYRNDWFKAWGIELDNTIVKGGFIDKIANDISNTPEYKDMFNDEDMTVDAKKWLDSNYYRYIVDPSIWNANNVNITYNDITNQIDSVSYDLIYSGIGNDDVAKFKSDLYNKNISSQEIFTKIIKNDDNYKDKYNGSATMDELTSVQRKYSVKWINMSTSAKPDFKLETIDKGQAYIDDQWVNIKM